MNAREERASSGTVGSGGSRAGPVVVAAAAVLGAVIGGLLGALLFGVIKPDGGIGGGPIGGAAGGAWAFGWMALKRRRTPTATEKSS